MGFSQKFRRLVNRNAPLTEFIAVLKECNDYSAAIDIDEESDSLIHYAVINDRLDLVRWLVQHGVSIEPLELREKETIPYPEFDDFGLDDDKERFTGAPLITAAARGKQEIFFFLAPLASVEQRRKATLHLAEGIQHLSISNSNDETVFQQMVDARPTSDDRDAIGQWLTDLAQATVVETSPSDMFKSLSLKFLEQCHSQISQGFDINTIADNGCTLLWNASHNGYVEVVRSLIDLGASVDIPNQRDGWTPLMIAVDAHIPWTFGTEMIWGKRNSRQLEIVELLLQAGANLHHQGHQSETALFLASDYEQDQGFEGGSLNQVIHEMEELLRVGRQNAG